MTRDMFFISGASPSSAPTVPTVLSATSGEPGKLTKQPLIAQCTAEHTEINIFFNIRYNHMTRDMILNKFILLQNFSNNFQLFHCLFSYYKL